MHIGDNLKYFMLSIPTFFLPAHLPLNRTLAIVIILLSIGVPITYLIIFHFQRLMIIAEDFRKGFQSGKDDFILTGIFLLPPFLSMIIIYPRAHYLLIFGVLAAITMIILFTNSLGKQEQVNMKNLLVLSILMILVTPRFDQNLEGLQKPNLNTIRFIQSLEIDEPVNLLGSDGGYNIYLGRNFHPIGVNEKNTNFNVFRTDHKINLIILSDTLLNSSRFKNDPEWQDFLVNSRQLGYVQIEIPNSDRRIIIQEKLLHE